jgi:hypothetical protein
MAENKNLVEDALIQMKNLEEAVAENAKGILASTMKEEIKELVKESLSEQDEDEVETDVDTDMDVDAEGDDETMDVDMDMEMDMDTEDSDEDMEVDMEMDVDTDMMSDEDEDETIDLTGASDEEVLKVFKAMGEDDGIIIKKDGDSIHLTDDNSNVEYMVKLGESTEDKYKSAIQKAFATEEMDEDFDASDYDKMFDDEEVEYEVEMDEESMEMDEMYGGKKGDDSKSHKDYMDEESMEMDEMWGGKKGDESKSHKDYMDEEDEEVVYEIEMDDETDEEYESMDMDESFMSKPVIGKGANLGMATNYGYGKMGKSVNQKGFKDDMPKANPTKGTGKAKFEYKETKEGKMKNISDVSKKEMNAFGDFGKMVAGSKFQNKIKKAETKEASRTLGSGSNFRKGGLPKPKAHSEFNANLAEEVEILRAKNEEYRKALNIFRSKLNEVAVFNANLAYATRLFTEHTTTKQEKINILRRFDGTETLKESKNLYQTIKSELSGNDTKVMTESIGNKIEKVQATGSSINLIESKTYENPQFLRMKDLMGKLK